MKPFARRALATLAGAAALTAVAGAANAYVVCNANECWHTHARYAYPAPGYVYHPDHWYFHQRWEGGPYRWHDYHPGRGYWRDGVWVTF